jgi:hypothetical protein
MTTPSLSTWILGGGATALLTMINWYFWHFAPVLPYPLKKRLQRLQWHDQVEIFRSAEAAAPLMCRGVTELNALRDSGERSGDLVQYGLSTGFESPAQSVLH